MHGRTIRIIWWSVLALITTIVVIALWVNYEPYEKTIPFGNDFEETLNAKYEAQYFEILNFYDAPLSTEFLNSLLWLSDAHIHSATTPALFNAAVSVGSIPPFDASVKEGAVPIYIFIGNIWSTLDEKVLWGAEKTYLASMEDPGNFVAYTETYLASTYKKFSNDRGEISTLSHEGMTVVYSNKWWVVLVSGLSAVLMLIFGMLVQILIFFISAIQRYRHLSSKNSYPATTKENT